MFGRKKEAINSPVKEIVATFKEKARWSWHKPCLRDRQTSVMLFLDAPDKVKFEGLKIILTPEEMRYIYYAWQNVLNQNKAAEDLNGRQHLANIYSSGECPYKRGPIFWPRGSIVQYKSEHVIEGFTRGQSYKLLNTSFDTELSGGERVWVENDNGERVSLSADAFELLRCVVCE